MLAARHPRSRRAPHRLQGPGRPAPDDERNPLPVLQPALREARDQRRELPEGHAHPLRYARPRARGTEEHRQVPGGRPPGHHARPQVRQGRDRHGPVPRAHLPARGPAREAAQAGQGQEAGRGGRAHPQADRGGHRRAGHDEGRGGNGARLPAGAPDAVAVLPELDLLGEPEGDLLRDVYLRGSPAVATVALTFDDGPNGRCTEAVLDALHDVGAPGAFFVLGENVARGHDDALLARMVREGHTIGVHSETHRVRPLFRRGSTAEELGAARAAVDAALARAGVLERPAITLFRPPFGFLTEAAAGAARDAGVPLLQWTVSVRDWEAGRRPDPIADSVLARGRPAHLIVLHDGDLTHHRSLERCRDRPNAAPTG